METKFLHLSGGFGSGKSHGLVMKALYLSVTNKPFPGGLVCPSYSDYKRDILPLLEDTLLKNRIKYEHHKTENWFRFPWSPGKLYIATAERPLRGPNWAYALINEVTLIPLERYREVVSRVRIKGAKYPQIASCGTPEGLGSEYYEFFIERPIEGSKIIFGDTRNNVENLGSDYIKSLEASFDSIMLDAYLKGLFINMQGNRFYYNYDPIKNDDDSIKPVVGEINHISLDFNVEPMTATIWNYIDGEIRAFDEIVLNDANTNRMVDAFLARGYTPNNSCIYPDPAGNARSTKGQPDNQILRSRGFINIRVKSHAPPMRQRQLNVNNLLEKRLIKLNPKTVPTLKKDLMAVEQDKATLEKIKSNPKLTHSSDGLDYLCDILFPFSGTKPRSEVIKFR